MKKLVKPLLLILIICFLLVILVWRILIWINSPVCSKNCSALSFIVNQGEGLNSIANRLEESGLIKNQYYFRLVCYQLNLAKKIQPGDFSLNPNLPTREIILTLVRGPLDLWVTFPEGWRREQIAERLAGLSLANFSKTDFLNLTKNSEGQLFPDTYLIPKTTDAEKTVKIINKNYDKKVGDIDKNILILASIIEREIPHKEDRPIIAGILLKRLEFGWPLQVDATIQYALASTNCKASNVRCDNWWPKNLTKNDITIKSPYNTYLNKGLPPAPICNPGLDAIEAARNPVSSEYWYYLSDKQGITHFSRTIEEHNQNINRYLK